MKEIENYTLKELEAFEKKIINRASFKDITLLIAIVLFIVFAIGEVAMGFGKSVAAAFC